MLLVCLSYSYKAVNPAKEIGNIIKS